MGESDLDDRVLLAIRDAESASDGGADSTTQTRDAIADAVGLESTFTARLELASMLSTLEADGLVRSEADDEPAGYRLTDAGRERADERYEGLASERVTVVTDAGRRELPLGVVATRYDVSLPTVLSLRTDDDAVYLEPDLEPAFVGREAERDRLAGLLETVDGGSVGVALLAGGPGIGKTALAEWLCADANERGFETAVGRCRRDVGGPYQPFRNAFGDRDDAEPLPIVDAPSPSAHDAAAYGAQLEAIYDRTAAWIEDRARSRPLVFVLEDVHRADAATVELLEHVLETVADVPLAVVCTARPGALESDGQLAWIGECATAAASTVRLDLDPLERDAVTELVERHVGQRGVPATFVDAIATETGGNPLFVVETVERALADGTVDPTYDHYPDPEDVDVADVVGTTVADRLDRLDASTRGVLEVGAVVGDVVRLDLLEAVVRHPGPVCRRYVDRLLEARLWRRTDGTTVRFTSDVVRSVVRDGIDDERATRLHRRIADALAEDPRADDATIAHHYERGGEPGRALEYWIDAGDHARALYAHDDAVAWYERALAIAREHGPEESVLEILESLGDVHYTRGEYERADKRFRYVRDRSDDPERIRRTYRYQARVRFERGESEETERYASTGLAVGSDDAVTREVCWLHDYRASAARQRGDLEAAIDGFETQRELAAEIDDDLLLGRAYQNLGVCVSIRGERERGVDYVERAASLLESAGDDRELARCLNDLAMVSQRHGQYDRATDALERCKSLATETGSPRITVLAGANLGATAIWEGRWTDAEAALEEAYDAADRLDNEEARGFVLGKRAIVERERGHLEDARSTFERSCAVFRDVENPRHRSRVRAEFALVHVLCGSFEAAESAIERAIELATDHGFSKLQAQAIGIHGRIERERGDLETAIESHHTALDVATTDCSDEVVATVRSRLAETYCRTDDPEQALEQGRLAVEVVPDRYRHIDRRVRVTYAEALRRTGAHDDARDHLTAVLEAEAVSNVTRIRCLRELGLLDLETGRPGRGRERLAAGRDLAVEIGAETFVDRLDDLPGGHANDDRVRVAGGETGTDANTDGAPVSDRRSLERDGKPGTAER